MMRRIAPEVLVVLLLLTACRTASTGTPTAAATAATAVTNGQRTLSVMLYPWIPDANNDNFAALKQYLITQFQAQNPEITLQVTIDAAIDTYNPSVQATLFQASGPNVVELDTVSMGDLVTKGYLAPVTFTQANQWAFATQATQFNGTTYGVPTWVCMFFFYGGTAAANPIAYKSGVWDGSWTLPSLYLAAYVDMNGFVPLNDVMTQPPDPTVVAAMSNIFLGCSANSANNCLNGVFKNSPTPGEAQAQYAQGNYSTTTGFSESLYYILVNQGPQPNVILPMVVADPMNANNPLAFTDSLVVNKASCTGLCLDDANTFAAFYNSPAVREYICFSQDTSNGPPRYLSPAVASFYQQPQVQANANYRAFQAGFTLAQGYPNQGLPAAKGTLNTQLCTALRATIPDACGTGTTSRRVERPGGH